MTKPVALVIVNSSWVIPNTLFVANRAPTGKFAGFLSSFFVAKSARNRGSDDRFKQKGTKRTKAKKKNRREQMEQRKRSTDNSERT
jgi:hypothetical protein